MATTSIPHRWKYDVFVSFRGEDIRKNFMDNLFNDFKQKGIHAYRDDRELPKGEETSPHIYKAIEESRFLIVIFSKNYASSSWCMRELVKILECKKIENPKYEVRIIFYDAKPYMVRKPEREYAKALINPEVSNKTEVDKWREALLSLAADLSGWDLQDKDMTNSFESKFIDSVSREILKTLCDRPLYVGGNLVGIDFHFDKLDLSRFVGSDKVNMIGICGISGIGKTTLAKAIYNLMYVHFEGSCFCEDVKEVTKRQGLIQVQLHMIGKIMKIEDLKISSVGEGIMVIKKMMSLKPILLVFDDVDDHEQLEALAGSPDWFFPGSLIIFTGKDNQLLRSHKVDEIYHMEFLDKDQSLQLFSFYAFEEKHPSTGFQELADKVVKYVQGHPLALIVLGRFLYGKTVIQWVSELHRLELHPNEEIKRVLRLSYDMLNKHQQNILLDIACLFIGENSEFVASILDGCNFSADTNMQVLVDKSLITIDSDMSIQMHNLIQEMAREIIHEESIMTGKQRRLWNSSEVYNVLSEKKVPITEAVEVLVLLLQKSRQKVHIDAKAFAHMKKLRILKIYAKEKFRQILEFKYLPSDFLSNELSLFCWHGYPFKYLPSDFYPENIVAIDLSYSNIKHFWTTPKCFTRLKVMKLRYCCSLITTPDFSEITNLEELILEGCVNLVSVHPSIGMLKRLVLLNLRDCKQLHSFPITAEMDALQVLNLTGCLKVNQLPEALGQIQSLTELHVHRTAITELPSFVSSLINLESLSFGGQGRIQPRWWTEITRPFGLLSKRQHPQRSVSLAGLPRLKSLNLSYSNLEQVPESIGGLLSLKELNLEGNKFTSLPGSLSQLSHLSFLKLDGCKKLEVLPELPPSLLGSLSQLSHLQQLGLNSEEGYFRKAVKFLSSKSLKHKDHGNISDIKAISEASKEKNLKHNITISSDELNPPSDPNREFIDQEVLSTSRTESSLDLIHFNYLQQAYILTRRKDFLHLMWFYPVKKEAEVSFGSLLDKFSSLNKYIRMSLDSSTDTSFPMEIQILLQDIKEYVDDAAFDMVAYLPEDLVQNWFGRTVEFQNLATGANFGSFWSDIPEIHASSIGSAIYRALRCIKDLNIKMLGIWGNGVEEVTATLRDLPELKSAFDMVLFVRIKHHAGIEYLMNDIEQEIDLWKKRSSETLNEIDVLDQLLNCLLFVDCSDGFFDLHEHQFRLSKWFQNVQIVMTSGSQLAFWQVEMEIRIQDHRLPWNIFFKNVDIATMGEDSGIKQLAVRMVEKCDGHLLAIILLARALRGVVEIGVWELALQELISSSQSGVITDAMVRVLRFIWPRMETVSQKCIIQFALQYTGAEFEISSLLNCWTISGVVKSETEAEYAFEDLERLFLIERVAEKFVRMRDETRVALLGHFIPRTHGLYLKQDGSKSNTLPSIEEWDVREIHLTNNILSELPDNPKCPILVDLFLHSNQDLMDVPITFFHNMPSLQVLDLSSTSLKSLPSSISRLTTLRKLFIRNCDLMMELPPEIGSLKNLKVFDSEGTQLICLPEQVGSLTKLECLKFSLYNFPDKYKQSNQNVQIIPVAELSKLVHLKELSICVDLYGEWWENEVKLIINILPKLRNLKSLRLHFPTTELFCMFIDQKSWEGLPIYQHLSNFQFIVGHLQQRLISRLPFDLDKMFVKLPKSLKFTSTEGEIEVISSAMKHANALFLDRHWTIQSLSTFGFSVMKNLKFCLLVECSEMLEIVNGSYLDGFSQRPVLGSLEYISIHRMKSLSCIWNGPIHYGCLSNLKTLVIHACPELQTIFTQGLLDNLTRIEYLAVEDCPKISSLVSLESNYSILTQFLPSLKKISLLHLPELFTISNGTSIAPRLECLFVYDCPILEKLSSMEVSDSVKEIKGENEWWDGLKWCEPEWTGGQPEYLARVFIPLGTDDDIMDELADAVNFLPHVSD